MIDNLDWPGWDRSARIGDDVLAVLEAYRSRYARVAELAGYGAEFAAAGEFEVVERLGGIGMTDYYGVSGRPAAPEKEPMSDAECERKIALLRAYREAVVDGIRQHHARGETARSWALQFLIRRCAWHMLDHAWELADRDLTDEAAPLAQRPSAQA